MQQPMIDESRRPIPPPRVRDSSPPSGEAFRERARALSRKLGRPLRAEIEGPLTDEQSAETILARELEGGWRPASETLRKHGRR